MISLHLSFTPPYQHPLLSHALCSETGTAGYPSHLPNSCVLTLSPSCAFVRTFNFFYKADEEEMAKILCIVSLKVHDVLCVCLCVHPSKSGATIRKEPDLFNEP